MNSRTYEFALELARSELSQRDLALVAERAGVVREGNELKVCFLRRVCTVRVEGEQVKVLDEGGGEVPVWLAVIILHYLLTASGDPLGGQLVDFRQLVGGEGYLPNFGKRAANRLAARFGDDAGALLKAGTALGGKRLSRGDACIELQVLPRVPVTLIVWESDEEFPASSKIVFDSSINSYLPTEDVVVVCQQLVTLLQSEV